MLNSVNTAYKRIIFIMKTIIHYTAYIYNIHNVKMQWIHRINLTIKTCFKLIQCINVKINA